MTVTREQVLEAVRNQHIESDLVDCVVDDILRIVNDGFRYDDRGETEEYRIPEDISTGIVFTVFGVYAYKE